VTYIDNVVGVDNKHAEVVQAVIPEENRPLPHQHRPHFRWLWWLGALLALSVLTWILTRTTAAPAGVTTFDRGQVETALNILSAHITDAYDNPNAATAQVPAEQMDSEVPVPSFQVPQGVAITEGIEREKAVLSALLPEFADILTRYPELNAVYFGSESGLIVRYMLPTVLDPNYDPRERPWYQQTLDADGQVFWTYPYADAFTGLQVITGAKPVYSGNGTLIGVVAVDMLYDVH